MSQRLVQARNVSMYAQDWEIVDAADQFDVGVSATLRKIVRQWDKMRQIFDRLPANVLVDTSATYVVDPFRTEGVEDAT